MFWLSSNFLISIVDFLIWPMRFCYFPKCGYFYTFIVFLSYVIPFCSGNFVFDLNIYNFIETYFCFLVCGLLWTLVSVNWEEYVFCWCWLWQVANFFVCPCLFFDSFFYHDWQLAAEISNYYCWIVYFSFTTVTFTSCSWALLCVAYLFVLQVLRKCITFSIEKYLPSLMLNFFLWCILWY